MAEFLRFIPNTNDFLSRGPSLLARSRIDIWLLLPILIIMLFGLVVLYSGSGSDFDIINKQLVRYGLALFLMLLFAQINLREVERFVPVIYMLGILLLVLVLLFGVGAKGAQRWLEVPGFGRFQPSELLKLAVPLSMAWFFAGHEQPPKLITIIIALAIVGIPVVLIAIQPDLGTSLLVAASGLFVVFYSGVQWRYITLAVIAAVSAAPLLWMSMRDYQKQRVMTFLDPESQPLGAGWNIIQSKIAIGSGGLSGKGWQHGSQSYLNYLPESHTDFILSVMAEEFGLKGVLFVMGLYLWILVRCLMVAAKAQDRYSRMIAVGLTMTFFVYIMVNVGMVSGLLPIVGVPLPLVSYGGTSAVTLLISMGMIMSIRANRTSRVMHKAR